MSQTVGLNRNTIDKYYTAAHVVEQCMSIWKQHIQPMDTDLVIEPSAGNGAFITAISETTQNYKFYDIEPEHPDIEPQDFLELNVRKHPEFRQFNQIHILGNPPFGRQSSTAIQFIKHAATFASSISFILPKSFKKDSMKQKFPPHFHLRYECELPRNAFVVDGTPHDVPCIFQIWFKEKTPRTAVQKLKPNGFIFVEKTEEPDISFRRVGVNAGVVSEDIENKSVQSHYFIQFTNGCRLEENMERIRTISFASSSDTVGPKSISKQELIREFNRVLQ